MAAGSDAAAAPDSDLAAAVAQLLPALRARLAGLGRLWRLGEPGAVLDPHGMDPTLLDRAAPLLDFLYLSWWRVEVQCASRLPEGPLLVVANRAGGVPWDALVLRLAFRRESPGGRDLRPLLDAALLARPLVGAAARRLGAVAASPANAAALLQEGTTLGVFPEGSALHPWPQRYRIGAFGRGGFAKVALRAGAAIVPCAIVGSEEASPPLDRPGFLADALHLPLLASVPGLPLGPLGGLPLPSRWKLFFGESIPTAPLGAAAAASPEAVARLTAEVRERLQALLDRGVAGRRSVFV